MYIPDTAILVTRFLSESGIAEVVDFVHIRPRAPVAGDQRRNRTVLRELEAS
jgi:hypothetical protein